MQEKCSKEMCDLQNQLNEELTAQKHKETEVKYDYTRYQPIPSELLFNFILTNTQSSPFSSKIIEKAQIFLAKSTILSFLKSLKHADKKKIGKRF